MFGTQRLRRAWPGPSLHCWAANIDFGYKQTIFGYRKSVSGHLNRFLDIKNQFLDTKHQFLDTKKTVVLYKKKHVGNYGVSGCFSFYPTKQITTGEGGAIITNDRKFYQKIKH